MGRTITALEVQKRNTERVSVYLDGEFAFGLPLLEAAKLRQGQELAEDEIQALRDIDALALAVDRAVRLLARRPYSTTEIRRNLATHDVAPPVIDAALEKLANLGYVDDLAFARFWIADRERFKPRGPRALRYELRQKGVSDAIIETALADVEAHDSAYRAAQERLRRLRGLEQHEFRNKLGAFLTRRGFGYDIVRDVIDQLINEIEEDQPEFFVHEE
ncbi:MAG: RecX family transcriptional regulator [Anaerolineae bacterium]|nr:RecX family transcriptional regulator [Anaerolineae bacterium]